MNRRQIEIGATTLGLGAAAALGYAVGVEPYHVEVVEIEIYAPRLPIEFDGYTIHQISDLHTSQLGRRERVLQSLAPNLPPADLVAFTGDLIHTPKGTEPFLELAKSFGATDGSYAIFGNSEHKNGVRPHAFSETLENAGIIPLHNTSTTLTRGDATIALVGVDDPVSNKDHLRHALRGIPEDQFTLLLMHSPDGIAEAVVFGVDVVLSGHTHGGQIRFPFIGAPYTHSLMGPRVSSGYYAGKRLRNAIGIRPDRTQMYITRGIGVSGVAMRFLCRPELTVIRLRHGTPREPHKML